jgi:hypothetical protein
MLEVMTRHPSPHPDDGAAYTKEQKRPYPLTHTQAFRLLIIGSAFIFRQGFSQ